MKKISEKKLLFTGVNGVPAYGYSVRSTRYETVEDARKDGYQFEWNLNMYSLNKLTDEELIDCGFNTIDIEEIRKDVK